MLVLNTALKVGERCEGVLICKNLVQERPDISRNRAEERRS
jgi:hypothetical protein